MSTTSQHVLALFGGASGEHAISVRSAAGIIPALEQAGHRVSAVGITRAGDWRFDDYRQLLARARDELVEVPATSGKRVLLDRGRAGRARLRMPDDGSADANEVDVVFPILHGPNGEDGTIQGMLSVLGVPFVGAGCGASAMAMDKLCMKMLCAGVGIPQTEFLAVSVGDGGAKQAETRITASFGFPCYVKPANLGSSVGISRVDGPETLAAAIEEARRWDSRVLVERAVDAREVEIALLGAERPKLSPLGEIVTAGFYDFSTKYVANSAGLEVPAKVSTTVAEEIRSIATRVWELIGCSGMARADFFVERATGRVLFNEINTIPGFTPISMYPRLWAAAGLELDRLVDELIRLAKRD